jgi:LPXTG-motif cell wall-anchored protein
VTVGWGETVTTGNFAVTFAAQPGGESLPATGQDLLEVTAFGVALLAAAFLILRLRG